MIVLKFGGTSVKNAAAMQQVFSIVSNNKEEQIVVLSACSGITDSLIILLNYAWQNQSNEMKATLEKISTHHIQVVDDLLANNKYHEEAKQTIFKLIEELDKFIEGIFFLKETTPRALDKVMSFGELLSTIIFHYYCLSQGLQSVWWDARKFMKTDSNFNSANVDFNLSRNEITNYLESQQFNKIKLAITQGFVGSDLSGRTTTLGRGGSDYTAAIVGNLTNAKEIQIWTDVNGILTADPRTVKRTKTIEIMEFNEVRQLAYFGAKVIHPNTLLPAIETGIPIKVLNTFNPNNQGTTIVNYIDNPTPKPHSIINIKCIRIDFPLYSYDNFAEKASEILSTIARFDFKVYYSVILPEGLSVWMDKECGYINNFTNACGNFFYELTDQVILLGITGIEFDLQISNKINDLLTSYKSSILYQSPKRNLIIIESYNNENIELLNKINDWIVLGEQGNESSQDI